MNLYIGIDWSSQKHDAAILNDQGAQITAVSFPHTVDGFVYVDRVRRDTGVAAADCAVGIETAYNILIDFLWDRGYTRVYLVPPRLVKSRRDGLRPSGAHTDQTDATLIASLVRSEPHLLQLWKPDGPLIRQLRADVSHRLFLTTEELRLANKLRSLLGRYYPAALVIFSDITTQIALQFVQAYPTPQAALALSYDAFVAFATEHGYRRPRDLSACYARLQQVQPEALPTTVTALSGQVQELAGMLLAVIRLKNAAERRMSETFRQHEDSVIFASLPGVGETLGPSLLAKFGDDRKRFPTAASVQAVAGTCPVTVQSGKMRQVVFRHACDDEFRTIAHLWARAACQSVPWARAYVARHLTPQTGVSQAYRRLANRLLNIAWAVWQNKRPYDERHHVMDCVKRSRPVLA